MNITRVMPFVLDSGEEVEIQITVTKNPYGHTGDILITGMRSIHLLTLAEKSRAGDLMVEVIEEAEK